MYTFESKSTNKRNSVNKSELIRVHPGKRSGQIPLLMKTRPGDHNFSRIPSFMNSQAKLTVNQSGDKYEQEADAVADRVMQLGHNTGNNTFTAGPVVIQRKCAACEKEDDELRRKLKSNITGSFNQPMAGPTLQMKLNRSMGRGTPLPARTNEFMSTAMGTDFSGVKIHTGNEAVQMNQALKARAFTYGSDIFFNRGEFNPESNEGKRLLGHELAHVIQQGSLQQKPIQRSCHDGKCESCADGKKTLRLTAYFRVRANQANMREARREIDEAKNVLKKCCVDLKVSFDWRLLRGGGSFDPGVARPAGNANGPWDYTNDSENLGEGNTFSGAQGIPALFVDDVPRTGGGVTVANRYDLQYTGPRYIVVALNQAGAAAQSTIAHELGHVGGLDHDTALAAANIMNTGEDVDIAFCNAIRGLT